MSSQLASAYSPVTATAMLVAGVSIIVTVIGSSASSSSSSSSSDMSLQTAATVRKKGEPQSPETA